VTARLTASGLPIAVHCLYGFRDDVELMPDKSNPSSRVGSAVHKGAELTLLGLAVAPTSIIQEFKLRPAEGLRFRALFEVWREWWTTGPGSSPGYEPEVKFALPSAGPAIRLPKSAHRDYDAPAGSLPGTADAFWWSAPNTVHVRDWKTGHGVIEARTHEQLRFLGAVAADFTASPTVTIHIDQITLGGVFSNEHVMSEVEIRELLEDARSLLRMLPASEPVGGAHCKYCRAANCLTRAH
jgi:hypothetical protein